MLQYFSIIFGNVKARFSDTLPTRSQRDFNSDVRSGRDRTPREPEPLWSRNARHRTRHCHPVDKVAMADGRRRSTTRRRGRGDGAARRAESQATALVRIHEPVDPDQIMVGTVPPADSQQSYISGEVTYLTSPGFANTVAKQLNVADPPRLSALQGVQSSVIGVSATNTDPAEAKREVDAALDVYRDHLRRQARERGQAAIDAIDGVLGRLNSSHSASRGRPDRTRTGRRAGDPTTRRPASGHRGSD